MTARTLTFRALSSIGLTVALAATACAAPQSGNGEVSDEQRTTTTTVQYSETLPESPDGTTDAVAGTMVINDGFEVVFQLADNGRYSTQAPDDSARYDPGQLTLQVSSTDSSIHVSGLAPSGPDAEHPFLESYLRLDTMAWSVDSAATGRASQTEGSFGAVEQWTGIVDGEEALELVVDADAASYIPISVSQESQSVAGDDGSTRTWQVIELDRTTFSTPDLGVTSESAETVIDRGFRLVEPDEAEKLSDRSLPRVGQLPNGFTLASITFAATPETEVNIESPPSQDVVVMTYRNGLRTFTVTTRSETVGYLRGSEGATRPWTDPYCIAEPCDAIDTMTIDGTQFDIVAGPTSTTHAWGIVDGIVVTIGGDVSVAELEAAVVSLDLS